MWSTFDHLAMYDPRRVNLLWFERVHKCAYVLIEPLSGVWADRCSTTTGTIDVISDDAGVFRTPYKSCLV
jgi:hypothetical protein